MKKLLIALTILAVPALAADGGAEARKQAIAAVLAQVDVCIAKNDAKCIVDSYAEDATYFGLIGGGKLLKSRAEILKAHESMLSHSKGQSGAKVRHVIQNVRWIGEQYAVVDCTVEVSGSGSGDGGPPAARNQAMLVTAVMGMDGGKWTIKDVRSTVVEVPNPNAPPAPTANLGPAPTRPPDAPEPPAAPSGETPAAQ